MLANGIWFEINNNKNNSYNNSINDAIKKKVRVLFFLLQWTYGRNKYIVVNELKYISKVYFLFSIHFYIRKLRNIIGNFCQHSTAFRE